MLPAPKGGHTFVHTHTHWPALNSHYSWEITNYKTQTRGLSSGAAPAGGGRHLPSAARFFRSQVNPCFLGQT